MLLPSGREAEKEAFPLCILEMFYLKNEKKKKKSQKRMDCGFRRTERDDVPIM